MNIKIDIQAKRAKKPNDLWVGNKRLFPYGTTAFACCLRSNIEDIFGEGYVLNEMTSHWYIDIKNNTHHSKRLIRINHNFVSEDMLHPDNDLYKKLFKTAGKKSDGLLFCDYNGDFDLNIETFLHHLCEELNGIWLDDFKHSRAR